MFAIIAEDGGARTGELITRRGSTRTPFFMPVITHGTTDRAIGPDEYHRLGTNPSVCAEAGCGIAIANALICSIAPGMGAVRAKGGLHLWLEARCMLFTDSGGYQTSQGSSFIVERRGDAGFAFEARWSGAQVLLTPELSIDLQHELGSDVALMLDDMAPYACDAQTLHASVERTHAWAERALKRRWDAQQLLFGITQGGTDVNLRERSARYVDALGFDGIAIGGIGIVPSAEERLRVVKASVAHLSAARPRYVMGVGDPADIVRMVGAGIDCFDAAYPSIQAGKGLVLTAGGLRSLKHLVEAGADSLDLDCRCPTCLHLQSGKLDFTLRHMSAEASAMISLHNVHFMMQLMSNVQTAIEQGGFEEFAHRFLQRWYCREGASLT